MEYKEIYKKCIDYLICILFLWLIAIIYKLHFPNIKVNKNNNSRKVAFEPDFSAMLSQQEAEQNQAPEGVFDILAAEKRVKDLLARQKQLSEGINLETTEMLKVESLSAELAEAKNKLDSLLFDEFAYLSKKAGLEAWCKDNNYIWNPSEEDEANWSLLKMCKHSKETCNDSVFLNVKDGGGQSGLIWDEDEGKCYLHPKIYKNFCDTLSKEPSKQRELVPGGMFEYREGLGKPTYDGSKMPGSNHDPPSCHPTFKYCKCEKYTEYSPTKKNCKVNDIQQALEAGIGTTFVREMTRGVDDISQDCSGGHVDLSGGCAEFRTNQYGIDTSTPGGAAGNCALSLLTNNPAMAIATAFTDSVIKAAEGPVADAGDRIGQCLTNGMC